MSWFTDLIQALPTIKTKFQLTGLLVGVAAFVAVRFAAPDAVVAQICAGSIGVLFLIFGQLFQAIPNFPAPDRVKLVITLFIAFLLFILCLVGIILYSLSIRPYKGTEVGVGFPQPIKFENAIQVVNRSYNVTIFFNKNCDETVTTALVQPNSTKGEDMKDYLEKLRFRIQKAQGGLTNYSVKQEGASYEILCQ
jgi:hypothetical protein